MTLTDDRASALAADAAQAAYFRRTLIAEREQILHGRHTTASQARRAEAEIRYIERLIERLDRRFATHWAREELAAQAQ